MKQTILTLIIAICCIAKIDAQLSYPEIYFDKAKPYNTNPLPAGTQFVDAWGYPYQIDTALLSDATKPDSVGVGIYDCSDFTLIFEDVRHNKTYGFNDTTHITTLPASHAPLGNTGTPTLGALRRWTACQVFAYISSVIKIYNLPTNKKPRILFRESELDGTGELGYASPWFPPSSSTPGYHSGSLYDRIASSQTNNTLTEDAYIVYDFGARTINGLQCKINSDAEVTLLASNELDLFSILLHEATHALGFLTAITSNGSSRTFNSAQGNLYTMFDKFTQDSIAGYYNIIDSPSFTCGVPSNRLISDLLKNKMPNSGVRYSIYSPVVWSDGSSLSHFDNKRDGVRYIMKPAYVNAEINRTYTTADLQALCSIGYSLKTYNCGDKPPVGLPDKVTAAATTSPVIVNVITNDYDPDGQSVHLDSTTVQLLNIAGTITIKGDSIKLLPNGFFCGNAIIKYRPYSLLGTTKVFGNYTTLTITIPCPPFCPADPCNLVCNGGFENGLTLNQYIDIATLNGDATVRNGGVPGWDDLNGAGSGADCFYRGANIPSYASFYPPGIETPTLPDSTQTPLPNNNRYLSFRSSVNSAKGSYAATTISESIFTKLSRPLVVNTQYRLKYKARAINGSYNPSFTNTSICKIYASFSVNNPYDANWKNPPYVALDSSSGVIRTIPPTSLSNVWTDIESVFTAHTATNYLVLSPDALTTATPPPNLSNIDACMIYLDDVSVQKVGDDLKVETTTSTPQPKVNEDIIFTAKVCNTSSITIKNIALAAYMPTGYTVVSVSPTPTSTTPNYTFTIDSLTKGECRIIKFVARVNIADTNFSFNTDKTFCARITNTTSACASQLSCTTVNTPATDISLSVVQSCSRIKLTVTNNGLINATGVKVDYTPPPCFNYQYSEVIGSSGLAYYDAVTKTIVFPYPIKPNASITIDIVGIPTANCVDSFKLTKAYDQWDLNDVNNVSAITMDTSIASPIVSSILGNMSLCMGDSVHLSCSPNGGVWAPSNNPYFTLSTTGVLVGLSTYTYTPFYPLTVSYTVTNANNCYTTVTKDIENIYAKPTVANITGSTTSLCVGGKVQLSCTTSGGVWSSLSSNATISSSGLVTALNLGSAVIKYTVIDATTGCSSFKTYTITINAANVSFTPQNITTQYCNYNQQIQLTVKPSTSNSSNTYTWTTPTQTNVVTSDTFFIEPITSATSFKYYVTATNSSGCSRKDSGTIVVNPCYVQCSSNTTTNTCTSLSGTLSNSSYEANKKYCASGNITLASNSNTVFTNSEVVFEPNTTITVPYNTTLTLNGCHLYSCNAMWQGIKVQAGGTLIIDGTEHSSFIEDADTAVKVAINSNYDAAYNSKPPIMLNVNNTIFNRNKIGIYINCSPDYATNKDSSYIKITNCVFTSRSIGFSNATNNLSWVSVEQFIQNPNSGNLSCPFTPQTFASPYIYDAAYSPTNFAAFLKPPFAMATTKPIAGIMVNNSIFKNNSLLIGATNTSATCNTNYFDNLETGISNNENAINITNCTFQNGWIDTANKKGYGVYATNCGFRQVNIATTGSNNVKRNAFYNMQYGIYAKDCYNVQVAFANIRSNQSLADTTTKIGKWGILVQGTSYNNINLSNNQIYNITNAIKVDNTAGSVSAYNKLNVNYNDIAASTSTTQYVLNAITLNSNINNTNKATLPIVCRGNTIGNAFTGIRISNWKNKDFVVDSNTITLKASFATTAKQYGITFTGNAAATSTNKNRITNNTITGNCNTCNQTGIYVTSSDNAFVSCNSVGNHKNGFMFEGNSKATTFWDNTMRFTNQNGLTLFNDGRIGIQGYPPNKPRNDGGCTSDNIWEGDSTAWASRYHNTTLCSQLTDPINSILYTRPTPPYTPIGTTTYFGNLSYSYSYPASIRYLSGLQLGTCTHCGITSNPNPVNPELPENLEALEEIALEDPDLAPTQDEADIMLANQQQLFDMLQNDPSLLQNSAILQNFLLNNQFGTLDYTGLVGYAISNNLPTLASALLNTWQTQGTPDANNLAYFTWIYNIQTDPSYTAPINEILAMANQCHLTGGNAVFAARNLYNSLTESNIDFDVDCNLSTLTSRRKPKQPTTNNVSLEISIYPNPTTGFVYIDLPTTEKTCWQITVTDMFGKKVEEKILRNKVAKTFIELKGSKGVYFVSVLNCITGKQESKKIILQ